MIVVLGSVLVQEGRLDDALAASRAHVERSRLEPGCLEHGVSIDGENPNRLIFVERWASMELPKAHFVVPASRSFVKSLAVLAAEPPTMTLYEAGEISPR